MARKAILPRKALAAAHGGFTTLCASPDTSPVNDSGAVTNLIRGRRPRSARPVRVLPVGAITRGLEGDLLSDMAGLAGAGCIALGNGARPVKNARVLRRCMAYAQTFGLTVMFSPENQALAADGYAHDGQVTTRLGLLGIPEVAETAAVMEMLLLAEETGVRLHLSQLSCGRSVEMLADARSRGIAVTADVAMHQLVFTEDALAGFDSRYHVSGRHCAAKAIPPGADCRCAGWRDRCHRQPAPAPRYRRQTGAPGGDGAGPVQHRECAVPGVGTGGKWTSWRCLT